MINKDKDGLFRVELDPLSNDIDELSNCEIGWYEVLFLVNGGDIALVDLFANHWDTIWILVSYTIGFCFAFLLKNTNRI